MYRIHTPTARSRSTEKYLAANASGPTAFKELSLAQSNVDAAKNKAGDRFDILNSLVEVGLGHVTEKILLLLRVTDLLSVLLVSQ